MKKSNRLIKALGRPLAVAGIVVVVISPYAASQALDLAGKFRGLEQENRSLSSDLTLGFSILGLLMVVCSYRAQGKEGCATLKNDQGHGD